MLVNPWAETIDRRKINRKYRKIIIDDENRIISENPKKEDLKCLPIYLPTIREILKLQEDECKKYLTEFIRHWKRKNGRVPREKDFNNNSGYPSYITFVRIFKTWNNAIREAGLQLHNRGGGLLCTDEELLEHLIKWYEDRDEPPSREDFLHNSKYPSFTPYNRFGGWQNSLKILGLDTDSLVRRGIIKTNQQKARLGEIFVNNFVIVIGLRTTYECNIENMKEYEITDEIRPIFEKWLENIKKQYNSKETLVREAKERLRKYVENKNKDMIKSNM